MSTRELYLGGPRQQNTNFAMLPAATFSAANPAQPFNKEQPVTYLQAREYDFGNDTALIRYTLDQAAAGTPIASGDVLGSVVIPAFFYALGFYWNVETINAGGTFQAATRVSAVTLLTATTTGTANSNVVAWPTAPLWFKTPDILDITLGTVPAGGMGSLKLIVGIFGWHMRYGNY